VVVSGTYNLLSGIGTVTVTGVGSHGTLSVNRAKKYTTVKGKLGNKPLHIRVRTDANDATDRGPVAEPDRVESGLDPGRVVA